MSALPAPQPERKFENYDYSAFFSYATNDDVACNSWVSCFKDELELSLPSVLNGIQVRETYLSGDIPVIAGRLSEALNECINSSFVLFIFVHQNYLRSEWCLHELRHFRERLGEHGFKERLYVIAMSRKAITALTQRNEWKELCPFKDQVWVQFFAPDQPDEPLEIYMGTGRGRRVVVAKDFWKMFVALREDLAEKIRSKVAQDRSVPRYPHNALRSASEANAGTAALSTQDAALVRVYIEGTKEQERYWESLGKEVDDSWVQVIQKTRVEPQLYLRPTGLPMSEIDSRPMLDDADGVVLVWERKTPDSMAAQIGKLEPKLCGPDFAPGVIAYLMKSPQDQPAATSIGNWPVLRFQTGGDGQARVLEEDAARLNNFLQEVLRRKRG